MDASNLQDNQFPADDADPLFHALFSREQCPDPDQLLDFHLMRLDLSAQNTLRTHLAICADCARELAQLTELDQAEASVENAQRASQLDRLLGRLRDLVPHKPLLPALWEPASLTPAMSLRGDHLSGDQATEHRFVYKVSNYRISLVITDNRPDREGHQIEGEVIDLTNPSQACSGSVRLFDPKVETLPETQQAALDELGFFVLEDITQQYGSLLIELADHSLWVQEIVFEPSQPTP